MHIVIITGMSGSGKTAALNTLEDLDYYCIDNLPPELLPQLLQTIQTQQKLAIGIDIRSGKANIPRIPALLQTIKQQQPHTHIIYCYANETIIKKRYSETRRKHPLINGTMSLDEAISEESHLLDSISQMADLRIDTSRLDIYQLAHLLQSRVCQTQPQSLSLMFQSFGFKHFAPTDSDYLFDVRCLPNPYWEHELRQFTGQDEKIQTWLAQHEEVQAMFLSISQFLEQWLPVFTRNQKPYMTVSIGCTGGKHRSVYLAEKLANHFRLSYPNTLIHHRELNKD
ncbi:MAG TPA: RNase adapter RapZ [Thiothrix sp.]|nr:RNase adapter RapZ [Thiothrix sp.]